MDQGQCFIFCKDILGVKTNIHDFKWVYGSVAPVAQEKEFEACRFKFFVRVVPERELPQVDDTAQRFQTYSWNDANHVLSCRRTIFRILTIGFDIRIGGNSVYADIGENYYRLVKNRVMNLHGVYYLLADLANMLLMKNGYLTLYASAVSDLSRNRCMVNFAPPNTGKTVTAVKMCQKMGYRLLGEDIVITDGYNIYACPWTSSYRRPGICTDSAGAFGRVNKATTIDICAQDVLTDVVVLSLGSYAIREDKSEIVSRIAMLNGYLFQYFSSPIIKLLSYFCEDYRISWNQMAERMIEQMVLNTQSCSIQCEKSADFAEILHKKLLGEA